MLTTNTHCQISSKVSHQNGMDVTNNKMDLEVLIDTLYIEVFMYD